MQNQLNKTETQAISSAQSLASVQTLLKAGLGCITFMRDLLPHDNFSESHFVTSEESASQDSSGSFSSLDLQKKRNVNSFKIMTMTRGYTDEADRLLNYLVSTLFYAPHTAVSPLCRNTEYSTPFRSSICVLSYSLFTLITRIPTISSKHTHSTSSTINFPGLTPLFPS